jgi:predicted transcriptional regulator
MRAMIKNKTRSVKVSDDTHKRVKALSRHYGISNQRIYEMAVAHAQKNWDGSGIILTLNRK